MTNKEYEKVAVLSDYKLDFIKTNWPTQEFSGVSFGDERLNRRCVKLVNDFSSMPLAPINQASEDFASTKAAYRFFGNDKVSPEKILSPHINRVLSRISGEDTILAVQDTSFLNFSKHKKTQGLGKIGNSDQLKGLILHSSLACTRSGVPLGLLSFQCWAREVDHSELSKSELSNLPIEEKESNKWLKALREINSYKIPANVVHIGDRECDMHEFFLENYKSKSSYLVRVCYNRKLIAPQDSDIYNELDNAQPIVMLETHIADIGKVELSCKCVPVVIKPPERKGFSINDSYKCWIIQVAETGEKPQDRALLKWNLITNIECKTVDDIIEKVDWYKLRWRIEDFHKILKSGCMIEKCRMQKGERLIKYIAMFCVIAWRIFWLVHLSRANPDADATSVLTVNEIETLKTLKKRFGHTLTKADKLSVKIVIVAIARLGGYLNRKHDPPPGPTVIWRGWQMLANMTEVYEEIYG